MMSWKELAEATTKEAANEVLETIPRLSTVVDPSYVFSGSWYALAALCEFKDPPPALGPSFVSLKPLVKQESIILHDCPVLDDITGEEMTKTIHLEVISCDPIISSTKAEAFKFWAADEDEHVNYIAMPTCVPVLRMTKTLMPIFSLFCLKTNPSYALSCIAMQQKCFMILRGFEAISTLTSARPESCKVILVAPTIPLASLPRPGTI
jgi:hypothetical protein